MKEYRQNAHVVSLGFWAAICLTVALFLFHHSGTLLGRGPRLAEILGGVALLVFGPMGFAIYLLRANMVWVVVDPARGLLVRGRDLVPWEAIEKVTRRRPRLRRSTGPAQMQAVEGEGWEWAGCSEPGCSSGRGSGAANAGAAILIVVALGLAVWLIFFVILPLLIVPVLEVFAPLGDRFTIETAGRTLVLRDLREGDEFSREIGKRVRVDVV